MQLVVIIILWNYTCATNESISLYEPCNLRVFASVNAG